MNQQNKNNSPLSMQDVILALQNYWASHGCMIVQPFNTEVGAGTANPATALRVLGPEPWRVAYVEPSVRPDDSRYGDNPNRLQTHTQFQVILKPDPTNPQELYLRSLEAIGIDLAKHDVRFVEDNWASPALGAWGLGWEVWLDGMEITQFTYFQQLGGITLDPVSVEVTYGLERIMMAVQSASHFKDIAYSDSVSYGEVFAQAEYEMSRYYLDDADVTSNRGLFDLYSREAHRLIELQLSVPAYVYVLKCSHAFNVLDARGSVSTTERAKAFAEMRNLTRDVARLWVEARAKLGHPLGEWVPSEPTPIVAADSQSATNSVLFEIGVEELPSEDVVRAADSVRSSITEKLGETRLGHGRVTVDSTPRRIVLRIEEVEPIEDEHRKTIRGPRASAAYDQDGMPTPALQGFLRSKNAQQSDLRVEVVNGVEHVFVDIVEPGRPATELLGGILESLVVELRSTKNIRWSDPVLTFSRPVRWLAALYGTKRLSVNPSLLRSGTTTRVLRTAENPIVDIVSSDGYVEFLASHDIILDRATRRNLVLESATALASSVGGTIDVKGESNLIDEITDIVESPVAILGQFEKRYLELPESVLTTVMRKHQRYVPVLIDGQLSNFFVAVANGSCDRDAVRAGNEKVLRARYEDALFFWKGDLAVKPEEMRTRLDSLLYEERLGSFSARADRIAALGREISHRCGTESVSKVVMRAGQLAKFDLSSQMVTELSSLAGIMAESYALMAGEPPEVARALAEMEMPRSSGQQLPRTHAGAIMSIADRFDQLSAMISIGATSTGSSDPFGVRRVGNGLVAVMRAFPELEKISIREGAELAVRGLVEQGVSVTDDVIGKVIEFAERRHETQLVDEGHEIALIRAVLPVAKHPRKADRTLNVLERIRSEQRFISLVEALQRVSRILPDGAEPIRDDGRLTSKCERALLEQHDTIDAAMKGLEEDLDRFYEVSQLLPSAIDAFFEGVLVMDPEPEVRSARLALLSSIRSTSAPLVDWSVL